MRKLLIATANKGKFAEFFGILKNLPFQLLTLKDIIIPQNFQVKETGKTLAENAVLKAKAYGKLSGLLTLADDTGLYVDNLAGRPGVATHRYAHGSDENRYQKLLKKLKGVSQVNRGAKFISAIALFDPKSNIIKVTTGECYGWIADRPKGTHGFGFDPVFVVEDLGKHFAELSLAEKNQVSHRAKALQKMKKILLKLSKDNLITKDKRPLGKYNHF